MAREESEGWSEKGWDVDGVTEEDEHVGVVNDAEGEVEGGWKGCPNRRRTTMKGQG